MEIVLPTDALPSAWIRGDLLGPEGDPLVGAQLTVWYGNRGHYFPCDPESRAFAVGPLPPKPVTVVYEAGAFGDLVLGCGSWEGREAFASASLRRLATSLPAPRQDAERARAAQRLVASALEAAFERLDPALLLGGSSERAIELLAPPLGPLGIGLLDADGLHGE